MKYIFYFLLVFALPTRLLADYAVNDTQIQVNTLVSGSDSLKAIAIINIVASEKTEVYPLLSAINDKKLFIYNNILVTLGEKQTSDDGPEKFKVLQVYPECKELSSTDGNTLLLPLSELKEIEFSRSTRLLLAPIMPYLNLLSPEVEKRKLAYSQFQGLKDKAILTKLYSAISQEKNKEIQRLGKETIFSIQLNSAPETSQKIWIDSLTLNWGPNTQSILEQYASAQTNADLKATAVLKAEELQSKHERLRMFQNLFSGLSLGSILIMIALGLSIVYGLAGVINMAHGEFLMIGAYTTYCVQSIMSPTSDLFFWISLPLAFVVAGFWGFVIERLIIRHLYSRPLESMLATWGVGLVLVQIARSLFGDLTAVRTPSVLSGGWEVVPHLVLPYNRLFIIFLSAFMITATYLVLYRSRLGLQIRAVTQNRRMSSCLGIETNKLDAMTFFLGSGLAGLAGAAMTLIGNVVPDMGQTYIVDSFLVVVTGGVGNIAGSIVSGFGIGFLFKILESFFQAVYGKVLILTLIILFLQYKPKGLFPDKGRIGED